MTTLPSCPSIRIGSSRNNWRIASGDLPLDLPLNLILARRRLEDSHRVARPWRHPSQCAALRRPACGIAKRTTANQVTWAVRSNPPIPAIRRPEGAVLRPPGDVDECLTVVETLFRVVGYP